MIICYQIYVLFPCLSGTVSICFGFYFYFSHFLLFTFGSLGLYALGDFITFSYFFFLLMLYYCVSCELRVPCISFFFALLLTRTSIYSTSKLLRLLRLWSDFIWIHSFHQRIKQELKKVTRYCEVDNIRCKVVFDKCTKFVFFFYQGVLCITSWVDSSSRSGYIAIFFWTICF